MRTNAEVSTSTTLRSLACVATMTVVCVVSGAGCQPSGSSAPTGEFARLTIDLGVVVSDIEKATAFYKDAVGFKHTSSFNVPQALGTDAGLSDNQAFDIRVLQLGEGETATKIKLMQFADAPGQKSDESFIHSTYGFSYLTIFVKDTTAAMARLKSAGVQPIAKGPVELPESIAAGIYLTVVRDPDGNLVELVGPKK